MSPVTPPSGTAARIRGGKLSGFWQRVSEGRQLDELWSQFSADARASYGFYMKEVDSEEMVNRRGRPRFGRILKALFWSLVMKLSPARRVLLIIASVYFSCPSVNVQGHNDVNFRFQFRHGLGAFVLAVAFAGAGRQSDDEARPGNRARNSDLACALGAAGSGWCGHRICFASAEFRRWRLLRCVLSTRAPKKMESSWW